MPTIKAKIMIPWQHGEVLMLSQELEVEFRPDPECPCHLVWHLQMAIAECLLPGPLPEEVLQVSEKLVETCITIYFC